MSMVLGTEESAWEVWSVRFESGIPKVERFGHIVFRFAEHAESQAERLNSQYPSDHYFTHRVTLIGDAG